MRTSLLRYLFLTLSVVCADRALGQVVVGDVDGDGTDDVVLTGTKGKDHFVVIDRPAVPELVVSWDRNGDGDFLDANELDQQVFVPTTPAFGLVRFVTGKGNDQVDVTFEGLLSVARVLSIELGSGSSETNVVAAPGAQILDGCLDLELVGSSKADVFVFDFGAAALTGASVGIRANLGKGADDVTIELGPMATKNTVDIDLDLGPQNDAVAFTKNGAWTGTSAVSIAVEAGSGNDAINATLGQSLTGSSSLEFRASLCSGNDSFETFIDASTFDIASATETGRVLLRGYGNVGRDTMIVNTGLSVGTIALSGLLDVDLRGEGDDDTLAFDFDSPGALGFGALGDSLLRLRLDGGTGNDLIHTNLSNDASGIPAYDVELRGDAGNDQLTYGVLNATPGGNLAANYPPRGAMLVDAGEGTDSGFAFGNAFAINVVRLP